MMKYSNTQTNNLKSHWAQQMIENMNSQTSFFEEQRENLSSSCLKEVQEKERGAYAFELMRKRTWSQLFQRGLNLFFDPSQRQHKAPSMRQREIQFGEIPEKDREAREIYDNSCEISKEGTSNNEHSQVLRCGTEIKQQATSLKTGLPRDKFSPIEKESQRLTRKSILTSFEALGPGPRMTIFKTYRRYPQLFASDLRQLGDEHRCNKNAFIPDKPGMKNQKSLPVPALSPCHSPKSMDLREPRKTKKQQKNSPFLRALRWEKNSKMGVYTRGITSFLATRQNPCHCRLSAI